MIQVGGGSGLGALEMGWVDLNPRCRLWRPSFIRVYSIRIDLEGWGTNVVELVSIQIPIFICIICSLGFVPEIGFLLGEVIFLFLI